MIIDVPITMVRLRSRVIRCRQGFGAFQRLHSEKELRERESVLRCGTDYPTTCFFVGSEGRRYAE